MIISQSNHYNYPTRSKQQSEMNNLNSSTTMTYNYGTSSYQYPSYPTSTGSSYDMNSYYYPPTMPMDYMPYYPTSTSPSIYPSSGSIYENTSEQQQQQAYYTSNDVNRIPYVGANGTAPYMYPTPQAPTTIPTTQRH